MTDDAEIEMLRVKLLNAETDLRMAQEEAARHALRAEIAIHARTVGLNMNAVDDVAGRLLAHGEWKMKGGSMVRHAAGTVPDVLPNGQTANGTWGKKPGRHEAGGGWFEPARVPCSWM